MSRQEYFLVYAKCDKGVCYPLFLKISCRLFPSSLFGSPDLASVMHKSLRRLRSRSVSYRTPMSLEREISPVSFIPLPIKRPNPLVKQGIFSQ
jgi:hypothetical protein